MARRIIHQLVDDLDGTQLEDGQGETVRFGLDGKAYEIDLSAENAAALQEALAPFVKAGRRQGGSGAPRRRSSSRDLDAIRAWARENGYEVADRGRISADVEKAYNAR
ncbi:Lsr2 family protein [Microbacterium sp. UCD-TDU]|uniref:histone-like nucleoid-structuring protein Lsr2 n=1 Tax=Microbacterium sp. UCD-TDU TaxID=1247714 RepID=UPI0003484BE6|nr:Lsr2 family protein [Microbacterium sp. UCD-TDU]EYT57185.1 hypothetical protein D514_0118330 [Microbacterium sp. UCD-TDU]